MQKLSAFKKFVETRNPELGAKLTGYTWFRNSSIIAEFDTDPEIKAAWEPVAAELTNLRRNRESRRDGDSRGDDSGGRSSRRGGGRRGGK